MGTVWEERPRPLQRASWAWHPAAWSPHSERALRVSINKEGKTAKAMGVLASERLLLPGAIQGSFLGCRHGNRKPPTEGAPSEKAITLHPCPQWTAEPAEMAQQGRVWPPALPIAADPRGPETIV